MLAEVSDMGIAIIIVGIVGWSVILAVISFHVGMWWEVEKQLERKLKSEKRLANETIRTYYTKG